MSDARRRWQCAAERCSSLWVDLFAATASQWHLKPARRPGTPQIFGCGKMTLSQRASVPLALRSADAPGIPIAAPPAGPEQEGAPLTIRGYLESWLRKHGPHLRRLSLAGCGAWVGDEELRLVADYCSGTLVCLDLCGCAQLSDEAVSDCLHRCTKLTMVSLAMMGQLSAEALRHYSPNAAAPESPSPLLRLQFGGEMMDEAAEEAARNQAERAAQLSAAALAAAVPLPPPQLERLDLTGCGGIGWHGLDAALAGCGEGLQEFSLRGQVAMPADGIVSIVGRCPNLTQVSTHNRLRTTFLVRLRSHADACLCAAGHLVLPLDRRQGGDRDRRAEPGPQDTRGVSLPCRRDAPGVRSQPLLFFPVLWRHACP